MKVDSTTACVTGLEALSKPLSLGVAPSQSFKLDLTRGFIFCNFVKLCWLQLMSSQMVFYTIPDPLLLMCSSLVKYYNVAQVWVVCGYLDGLPRNCCYLQKSESRSTGFSSGFPVTVGFPKKNLSDAGVAFHGINLLRPSGFFRTRAICEPLHWWGPGSWSGEVADFGGAKTPGFPGMTFVTWNQWRMERYWECKVRPYVLGLVISYLRVVQL